MEEDTIANKEVPVMEVGEKLESIADSVQGENERKDDSKNSWDDGEFVKVDKETFDVQVTSAEEGKPSVGESSRELLEAREKIKELEIEMERMATALKASESQNVELKDEISLKEEKLEGNGKKNEELELDRKNLQEKMTQAENNFNEKINALQHASEELVGIKELYDNLNLDYQSSKRKIEELEGDLESQAAQFGDTVKSCHSKIEGADKRVSEVESLLEAKRKIIEELAGHLSSLESKCVDEESESKKYSGMVSELTQELEKSRSSVLSLESALQIASEKENDLVESLMVANEEKRNSAKKLHEAENMLDALRNELSLTQEKVGGIENDLKASGLRESEIIEKLRSAESQLEQQEREIEEVRARKMELQSLHESSTRDFDLKMQEAMANFSNKESEAKSLSEKLKILEDKLQSYEEVKRIVGEAEGKVAQSLSENELLAMTNSQLRNKIDELQELLNSANSEKEATSLQLASHMNTITELTDQHSRSIEISHTATETHRLQAEGQLKEVTDKLADKEGEVKELNERLVALEGQVKRYEVEAHESAGIAEFRKLEVQEMVGKLVQKDDEVKELNGRLTALESQVKIYEEEIHQASGLADSRKVEIDDMIAKLGHKDLEMKDLHEKIYALEIQLKAFQEEASEVSSISESRKFEIEQTLLKLQDHSRISEELQFELSQIETRNEALAEANMKLTQDLALTETEQSDLHAKLSRARDDKDDLTSQYDLSKKIIEDLTEELSFEKQRRQSEIATVLEESGKLHETKKELQAIVNHLEDQLEGYKGNEDTRKAELENLKVEITEQSALQASLKDEVKNVQEAAIAREGDLTSQLEHHVRKLHDRDLLDERVLQLEQELQLAQATVSKLVSELETARSRASDNLEDKTTEISLLAKKVEELEQKLKMAKAIPNKQKAIESNAGTQEVQTEVRSRDIGSMVSSPVKLKSNTSEKPSAQMSSSALAQAPTSEASFAMNFKLILGVALVSIIIGVILGKRY